MSETPDKNELDHNPKMPSIEQVADAYEAQMQYHAFEPDFWLQEHPGFSEDLEKEGEIEEYIEYLSDPTGMPQHAVEHIMNNKVGGEAVFEKIGLTLEPFAQPIFEAVHDTILHISDSEEKPDEFVPRVSDPEKYKDFLRQVNPVIASEAENANILLDTIEVMRQTVTTCLDKDLLKSATQGDEERLKKLAEDTFNLFADISEDHARIGVAARGQYGSQVSEDFSRLSRYAEHWKSDKEAAIEYVYADAIELVTPPEEQGSEGPIAWHKGRKSQAALWGTALEYIDELDQQGQHELALDIKANLVRSLDWAIRQFSPDPEEEAQHGATATEQLKQRLLKLLTESAGIEYYEKRLYDEMNLRNVRHRLLGETEFDEEMFEEFTDPDK